MRKMLIKLTNMKSVRFGKGLTKRRKMANLSQKQLANEVGITETYLNRLEEGYVSEFESTTLEKLVRALSLSMRGKPSYDDLVNLFLYVPTDEHPLLL